jgi:hypothetical protein
MNRCPRSWEGNATSQTTRERASASVDRKALDQSLNGGLDPRRERKREYMTCLAYTIYNRPVVLLSERPRIKTREQAFDLGAVSQFPVCRSSWERRSRAGHQPPTRGSAKYDGMDYRRILRYSAADAASRGNPRGGRKISRWQSAAKIKQLARLERP